MKVIENRFGILDSDGKNIVFDIQTNRVYLLEELGEQGVQELTNKLQLLDQSCNHTILENSTYDNGSNLAININLTPFCNLKCVYCFAQGGNYGSLEKDMTEDVLEDLLKIIVENKTKSNRVRLEFFGGEPLINLKMIKEILKLCNKLSASEGIEFIYRISTNLTFMNDEILNVLGENNFIVSVSIDGEREVQNLLRPFKNDEGSFDKIMDNVKLIRSKYNDLTVVARLTIAQKKIPLIQNIKSLIATEYFDYVSIYPASVKDEKSAAKTYKYFFDEDIEQQIKEVIQNYYQLFNYSKRFKGILEYERVYDQILNGNISVSHCAAGGTYFTISGDKSVVPCHRLCGKKEFILNRNSASFNADIINKWVEKVDTHLLCQECWARYICGGGCKQEHLSANGDIRNINLESCKYHKFVLENLIASLSLFPEEFNKRCINVEDLFVYCGRPVVSNFRQECSLESNNVKTFG